MVRKTFKESHTGKLNVAIMRGVKKDGEWSVRVDHRGLDLVKSLKNASPRKVALV